MARSLVPLLPPRDSEGMSSSANTRLSFVVGALLVIALIVAALSSTWSVQQRDPASPEGVVQTYLSAVLDRRSDDAAALLAKGSSCTAEHFDTAWIGQGARVDLVDSTITGDTAKVDVRVEFSSGDPFGGTYGEDHAYRLLRENGQWHINGIPWPLYGCGELVK